MDEEDTYQTLAGQVLDPFIEQGKRVVDWSGRVFEGRSQELQGVPAAQRNEEARPIGTSAVLNGRPVRWAGQNYGWQSDASYTQLEQSGQFRFGQITGDRIMTDVGQAVGDIIENIPEPVKQTAVDVAKTGLTAAADAYASLPLYQQQNIATGVEFVAGTARAINGYMERFSETTNTSRYITDELFMVGTGKAAQAVKPVAKQAATTAVKKVVKAADDIFPPGAAPQLAYAVAAAAPTPPVSKPRIQGGSVFMSTTSPPWTSPKAGLGSAESELFAPAVKRWENRESLWQEALENLRQSGASSQRIAKFEAVRKGDLSTFDYDPENLYDFFDGLRESPYFKQTRQRGELKALEAARPFDPYDLTKRAQQHHILAKAETKPFVETLMRLMADNIANKDDLVNFFVWSEKYDLIPGNVQKNLLHMGEVTHTVAKKDPMALHNLLKEAGLEYGSRTGPEMVKRYGLDKVTSADELMQAYDKYLQEIAIPSRDITYKAHDWWYDKTVKTLKGKKLAEFKANYSKLSDPRKIK